LEAIMKNENLKELIRDELIKAGACEVSAKKAIRTSLEMDGGCNTFNCNAAKTI
jgi:hypothetical protein